MQQVDGNWLLLIKSTLCIECVAVMGGLCLLLASQGTGQVRAAGILLMQIICIATKLYALRF
jgi:hypothetical protein